MTLDHHANTEKRRKYNGNKRLDSDWMKEYYTEEELKEFSTYPCLPLSESCIYEEECYLIPWINDEISRRFKDRKGIVSFNPHTREMSFKYNKPPSILDKIIKLRNKQRNVYYNFHENLLRNSDTNYRKYTNNFYENFLGYEPWQNMLKNQYQ